MNLFDIFKKKSKEENFQLPDNFEISFDDVREYIFMTTSKTYTDSLELEREVDLIDSEISRYKNTLKYKILSTKLRELDFKGINVKQVPYVDNDIDIILGLKGNSFQKNLYSPSLGVSLQYKLMEKEGGELPIGSFLHTFIPFFMNFTKIVYKKGKNLELYYELCYLKNENDNSNEEITYLCGIKDKNVKNLNEYFKLEDGEKKIDYKILYKDSCKKIIIQNLKLSSLEFNIIENIISKNNDFESILGELYKNFYSNISFVSKIGDKFIILGNDIDNTIYTTFPYEEWTNGLKDIDNRNKAKIMRCNVDIQENNNNHKEDISEQKILKYKK